MMDGGPFVTVDCTVARKISSITPDFSRESRELSWTWDDDYRGTFIDAANHVEAVLNGAKPNGSTGSEAARSLEMLIGFSLSHYTRESGLDPGGGPAVGPRDNLLVGAFDGRRDGTGLGY